MGEHVGTASFASLSFDLRLDTALSWDGVFPEPSEEDYAVQVRDCGNTQYTVLVSRRYLPARNSLEAVELAVDAVKERFAIDVSEFRWVAGWGRNSDKDHYWSSWTGVWALGM